MSEPTPEEIERVRAYDNAKREEAARRSRDERTTKTADHVHRIHEALLRQTILAVEVEGMNSEGEISMRGGHLQLGLSSRQILTVSVGGWHEPYLSVEIKDA